ncbi:hypothetical protein TNCV_1248421 [Trichonephila clavipes]|nr:hypothetical protein TNCV_1248421 [Trichonephila clavipes]
MKLHYPPTVKKRFGFTLRKATFHVTTQTSCNPELPPPYASLRRRSSLSLFLADNSHGEKARRLRAGASMEEYVTRKGSFTQGVQTSSVYV